MAKRAGTMTDRQRIEALLNRQKPDRVPVWFATHSIFAVLQAGGSIADTFTKLEVCLPAMRKASQDFGWAFLPYVGYGAMGVWEFGGEIKWPTSEFDFAPSAVRYPVETPDDAMNLKMPDIKNSGSVPFCMELSKMSSQEKLDNEPFNVICFSCAPFTLAANLPGPGKFAKWLLKEPKACHHLLRLATDYIIGMAQYWKDTFGAESVLMYQADPTSANQIISPRMFEQFALPYQRETNEKILAMGYKTLYMHICGEQNLNLPYWAQIPFGDPGIVSFGHEVDLETAAKYFPNDIIFGNLEPTIIQTGTPEEVYQASRKVIEKGKTLPTGFIFSAGCSLPARAPVDNIMAMTRAVNNFGWYE